MKKEKKQEEIDNLGGFGKNKLYLKYKKRTTSQNPLRSRLKSLNQDVMSQGINRR